MTVSKREDLGSPASSAASAAKGSDDTLQPTPGPWRVDPHYSTDVIGGDGRDVAETTLSAGYRRPLAEQEANARLIAAAPTMKAVHEDTLGDLHLLAAAIRAGDKPAELLQRISWIESNVRAAIAKATHPLDEGQNRAQSADTQL